APPERSMAISDAARRRPPRTRRLRSTPNGPAAPPLQRWSTPQARRSARRAVTRKQSRESNRILQVTHGPLPRPNRKYPSTQQRHYALFQHYNKTSARSRIQADNDDTARISATWRRWDRRGRTQVT